MTHRTDPPPALELPRNPRNAHPEQNMGASGYSKRRWARRLARDARERRRQAIVDRHGAVLVTRRPAARSRRQRQRTAFWDRRLEDCRKALAAELDFCSTHRVIHGPNSPVRNPETCETKRSW